MTDYVIKDCKWPPYSCPERTLKALASDMRVASEHLLKVIKNGGGDTLELREAFRLVTLAALPMLTPEYLFEAQLKFIKYEDD